MLARKLAGLTIALSALAIGLASAEGDPGTTLVVVEGLAAGDLLNVRATASAFGMVIGRLPNGATLRSQECDEVKGYKWCKVVAIEDDKLNGWVPARYLQADDTGVSLQAQKAPGRDTAVQSEAVPPSDGTSSDVPTSNPKSAAAVTGEAGTQASTPPSSGDGERAAATPVPDELSARLGAERAPPLGADREDSASLATSDAVSAAFRTAFAAKGASAGEDRYIPGSFSGDTPAAPAAEAVDAGSTTGDIRSEADSPPPAEAAASDIPCARYIGQPMTRCGTAVARQGTDSADVIVSWPDGGKRIIRFRAGQPEGADSRADFRFTREGPLNMIRIGVSERFEILDAVAFGD